MRQQRFHATIAAMNRLSNPFVQLVGNAKQGKGETPHLRTSENAKKRMITNLQSKTNKYRLGLQAAFRLSLFKRDKFTMLKESASISNTFNSGATPSFLKERRSESFKLLTKSVIPREYERSVARQFSLGISADKRSARTQFKAFLKKIKKSKSMQLEKEINTHFGSTHTRKTNDLQLKRRGEIKPFFVKRARRKVKGIKAELVQNC